MEQCRGSESGPRCLKPHGHSAEISTRELPWLILRFTCAKGLHVRAGMPPMPPIARRAVIAAAAIAVAVAVAQALVVLAAQIAGLLRCSRSDVLWRD